MRLLHLLFRNFLYKVVALVVAIVLWAATQGFRSVDASVDLAVTFEDQPDELVVISQSAREVNLRLVGSRWAVRRAAQQMELYPVSLQGAAPGEIRFQIEPSRFPLPRGAEVSAWSPSNISVKLDEVIEKSVRVSADVGGDLAEGFQLEGVEVDPPVVALRGASSILSRLREVSTDRIDLADVRETRSFEVPLVMGRTNIWRAQDDESPIRVLVRVVPEEIEEEAPPDEADSSDDELDEALGEETSDAPAKAPEAAAAPPERAVED